MASIISPWRELHIALLKELNEIPRKLVAGIWSRKGILCLERMDGGLLNQISSIVELLCIIERDLIRSKQAMKLIKGDQFGSSR